MFPLKIVGFYIQDILIMLRFSRRLIASRNSLFCLPVTSKCCIISVTGVCADPLLWCLRCK